MRFLTKKKVSTRELRTETNPPFDSGPHFEVPQDSRIRSMELKVDSLTDQLREREEFINSLVYNMKYFQSAIPFMEKLAKNIIETTERENKDLTENIFDLSTKSETASKTIYTLLEEVTEGETGLMHDSEVLCNVSDTMKTLSRDFKREMENTARNLITIENEINKIFEFTENINDTAEKTAILAINTAIEAARAGSSNGGFQVIAKEIKSLANQSKDNAVEIENKIKDLKVKTKKYFTGYIENYKGNIEYFGKLVDKLSNITELIRSQANLVEASGSKSRDLSDAVKDDIGKVAVSLQYQDITRQQIENLLKILVEISKEYDSVLNSSPYNVDVNYTELEEKIKNVAVQKFTVSDEYKAIDREIVKESADPSSGDSGMLEDLEGDITLF